MSRKKQSAGLLMYDGDVSSLRVLIAHPGGPIFVSKDEGYWGIPKGEFEKGESAFEAALREFEEETGMSPESDLYIPLGSVVQKGGKTVYAWAFEGRWPMGKVPESNRFMLEWPPKSGKFEEIPEIDEVMMATMDEVEFKMKLEQQVFVDRLINYLKQEQKLDLRPADK